MIEKFNSLKNKVTFLEKQRKDSSRAHFNKIEILLATKGQNEEKILKLINENQRIFGENRVEEAFEKWHKIKQNHSKIELHLIGHLQSKKAAEAFEIFDVIQTLDSEKIAGIFCELEKQNNVKKTYFAQINIGQEAQKNGISPSESKDFIRFCRHDLNLNLKGLMCIPPVSEKPHFHFALMQKIARENQINHLSMGMSSDFEEAIKFGSTMIRIGNFVFG